MMSNELAEFLLAKIEARTLRIRKATEEKNVNFDIKQFKDVCRSDLETAGQVTEKLIEESEDKESCDEIRSKFIKVQQELEEAVDAFELLMLQKWTIVLSQFCSNVMGGCLSSGVKMTANYVAYAVKLNKWPLLSQVVTVFISAICLSFQLDVQCYYDYYWYHEYEECDLLLRLIPPRRTFAVGGVVSLAVCILTIILDFICASNSIRSRLEGCVLCLDLILSATLCLDWAIMLAASTFTFKYLRHKSVLNSRKRHAVLAMVLSAFVILLQIAVFVVKLVQMIRRKLRKRAQRRMMRDGVPESWSYSGMLNNQENGSAGQLSLSHVERQ
ncbi:uncharacterized protein LOC142337782 [Convolutriloba macropyga]|uniref:uncharacterized protein LOC142337782 n=1 Tax=Convolutriloba macropyga TaxID=536237 RepID=UPI003F51ECB7